MAVAWGWRSRRNSYPQMGLRPNLASRKSTSADTFGGKLVTSLPWTLITFSFDMWTKLPGKRPCVGEGIFKSE